MQNYPGPYIIAAIRRFSWFCIRVSGNTQISMLQGRKVLAPVDQVENGFGVTSSNSAEAVCCVP